MRIAAEGGWHATLPAHLIVSLKWARYDSGVVVWSWTCICGDGGSAQNDHIGSALNHHLAKG